MRRAESVRIALRSIRAHKLRSALTVLGIVIGVASVVTFATFGASVQADVVGEIEGSSANNVYAFATPTEERGFDQVLQPVFTARDVAALREVSGVRAVIPRGVVETSSVALGSDAVARQQITATTPATFDDDAIVAGRGFRSGAAEIVLNERARDQFAGNASVGDRLTVTRPDNETWTVTVVGVVNRTEGQLPVSGFAPRARLYVPVDPFYRTVVESPALGVRQRAYPQVTVVSDPTTTAETKAAVETYLREESDARDLKPDGTELVLEDVAVDQRVRVTPDGVDDRINYGE